MRFAPAALERGGTKALVFAVVLSGSLAVGAAMAIAAPTATLQVVPGPGTAGTPFTAIYTYTPDAGAACPQVLIIFTWDGAEVLGPAQPLTNRRSGCQAILSTVPPTTGAQPGLHAVCGTYTPPSSPAGPVGAPVTGCGTFTVSAASPSPSPRVTPTPATSATTRVASPSPSATIAVGPIILPNSASGASPLAAVAAIGITSSTAPTVPARDAVSVGLSSADEVGSLDVGWWLAGGVLLLAGGLGAGFVSGAGRRAVTMPGLRRGPGTHQISAVYQGSIASPEGSRPDDDSV